MRAKYKHLPRSRGVGIVVLNKENKVFVATKTLFSLFKTTIPTPRLRGKCLYFALMLAVKKF